MTSDEQFELIERYLQGESSPAEVKSFESRIQNDPAFALAVQRHRDIQDLDDSANAFAFENLLTEIEAERKKQKPNSNRIIRLLNRPILQVAAVIVFLVATYLVWRVLDRPHFESADELYLASVDLEAFDKLSGHQDRELRSVELPVNAIDSNSLVYDAVLIRADSLFQLHEFSNSEFLLDSLLQNGDEFYFSRSETYYNLGMIQMYHNKFTEAIGNLSQVNGDHRKKATWYIAMAHIKVNNLERAREILEEIAKDPLHSRKKAAADALSASNIWEAI